MMRFLILAAVLLATVAGTNPCFSQVREPNAVDQPRAAEQDAEERPMSVFNDKVRRFRFCLEGTPVTAETAEEFMVKYQGRDQTEIIGAYADTVTNSLVVVGPPEAEHAIRTTLAKWIVDRQGLSPAPIEARRRGLEFHRQELLGEMADLEIQKVAADGSKGEQLQVRLQTFEDELRVVERQLEVVTRYIERSKQTSHNAPGGAAATAAR
jgi:hypothetical protein